MRGITAAGLLLIAALMLGTAASRIFGTLEAPVSDTPRAIAVGTRLSTAPPVTPAAVVRASPIARPATSPTPTPTPGPIGSGYWHTDGTRIVDAWGRSIRIASVTWYGMESTYWVPAGLDYQPYTSIMDTIKGLGYNAIRLPYSNELVEHDPVVTDRIKANSEFQGVHAMQVMDAIMNYAHKIGIKIILDDHRCRAATPNLVNYLDEPRWYTSEYPESSWIADWKALAARYAGNDALIGVDLRNEPHTNGPGPWNLHAYLYQGSIWGPYDGTTYPHSDWRLAARRGGDAVLGVNPHLLIFVEGVQLYPNPGQGSGVDSYWWSGILSPVRRYPVVLAVPHQLVYSPHDWGPWKWEMPWFRGMTYESMQRVWNHSWSFILNSHASYAAPVWLGEFGTCTNNPGCVDDQTGDNQAVWFHLLLRYLHDHPEVGWSFFALNGTNSNDHVADNGLLNARWDDVANVDLQRDLASIQSR
ncbi:MAG: glycoside hydrolase family 5 protein [Chloroflexota bacterium]|nr:MAG: hypothetical protein DLM70_10115 [Chloroflexota bacterium]